MIRRVLGSLGVHNVRYLRVLGRMKTRNTWLKELRAEGRLTEIQVRVVRELVESVAAEKR